MRFENKTVLISGAASGMGLLAAQCFAKEGAHVVLTDINEEAVKQKAEEICAEGGSAIGTVVDVRKYDQVKAAVDLAVETYKTVDVMINFAGGAEARMLHRTEEFKDMPIEVYDWSIDVNLKGQFYFDHAVMSPMARQKSGLIINIGSITGAEGCPTNVGYSASKSAAMNGLTKSLAQYGAQYGVRAVCVAPGPVLTRPGMAHMKTLLGRAAEPKEVVDFVLFLASDEGAFINGESILIDGGRNAMHRS